MHTKKTNQPIRIGIIGMGEHMVRSHLVHLIGRPDVAIVSWSDLNESALEERIVNLAKDSQPKEECLAPFDERNLPPIEEQITQLTKFLPLRTNSEEEVYDNPDINAVMIGSPDIFHADQLLAAVKAGKHVFCEKPIFQDFNGAEKFIEAMRIASERNLIVSTCHPRRFDPPFMWLKLKLSDPEWVANFGEIEHFEFTFWYHEVTSEWKKNRSLLLDHFGHEIDLLRFLFPELGDPGIHWKGRKLSDGHDHYQVQIEIKRAGRPFTVTFRGYRTLPESVFHESVRLVGTKEALTIQLNEGCGSWERKVEYGAVPGMDYERRFKGVNDNFLAAIQRTERPYLSHDDMMVNNLTAVHLVTSGQLQTHLL